MRARRTLLRLAAAACLTATAGARAAPVEHPPTVFAPAWDALVGRWQGGVPAATRDADVPPAATATVVFDYELDGRLLTRRRVTDLSPARGRPAVRHEDLMTIYPAPDGRNAEAMYFDSEGHVVHYAGTWSSDERTLVFLSFPEEKAPRMKLTWRFEEVDVLTQTVEVAPPGSVDFRPYDAGTLRRVR